MSSNSKSNSAEGLCPRSGMPCVERQICVDARDKASDEIRRLNSLPWRIVEFLAIGLSTVPKEFAQLRVYEITMYEQEVEQLNDILVINCGEGSCIAKGALEVSSYSAAQVCVNALRTNNQAITTN